MMRGESGLGGGNKQLSKKKKKTLPSWKFLINIRGGTECCAL